MTEQEPNTEPNTEPEGGNREAAKYRRQLRDAEAQRDTLADTVEGHQRSAVEQLAAQHLASPTDLFQLGNVAVADLLDDEGQPSAEAVQKAAQGILADRPGLAAQSATEQLQSAASEHLEPEQLKDLEKSMDKFGDYIDPAKFTDASGGIDVEKLESFIDAARPRAWPDMGGGSRNSGLGKAKSGNAWSRLVEGK